VKSLSFWKIVKNDRRIFPLKRTYLKISQQGNYFYIKDLNYIFKFFAFCLNQDLSMTEFYRKQVVDFIRQHAGVRTLSILVIRKLFRRFSKHGLRRIPRETLNIERRSDGWTWNSPSHKSLKRKGHLRSWGKTSWNDHKLLKRWIWIHHVVFLLKEDRINNREHLHD